MISLTECLKSLKNIHTKFLTFRNNNTITNYTKNIIMSDMNSPTGVLYNKIKKAAFKNLPPKIGYFNETTVPIFAQFNMNIPSGKMWCVSDYQSVQNLYFMAYPSQTQTDKTYMFRAYRTNTSQPFSYENEKMVTPVDVKTINSVGATHIIVNDNILYDTHYSSSPKDWELITDKLDLANKGYIFYYNILYFPEYRTVYLIGERNRGILSVSLYYIHDNGTLGEEFSRDLFNYQAAYLANNPDHISWNYPDSSAYAYYNSETEELVCCCNHYCVHTNPSGGSAGEYHKFIMAFRVPQRYFAHQWAGWELNKFKGDDYKRGGRACIMHQDAGSNTCVYDEISHTINVVHCQQGVLNYTLYITDKKNAIENAVSNFGNLLNQTNHVEPDDTAPWSKLMRAPQVYNEDVFINGYSKRYNYSTCRVGYTINNNMAEWKSSEWWMEGQHSDRVPNNISVLKQGNSYQTFAYMDGEPKLLVTTDVTEDGKTYHGVRHYNGGYPKPPSSVNVSGFSIRQGPYYFPDLFLWFGHYHNNAVGYKAPAMVGYTISTRKWTLYNNITQSMIDQSIASIKAIGDDFISGNYLLTNLFKEGNSIWFDMGFQYVGGHGSNTIEELNLSTGVWTSHSKPVMSGHYMGMDYFIGWNNKFHYYATQSRGDGTTQAWIHSSKNSATGADYGGTFQSFIEQGTSHHTLTFNASGAIGLTAYLQATPIFLGGYFTLLPMSEVSLYANATNYIYLQRNSSDYKKIDIIVRTSAMSVDNFNTIHVATIKTNADAPITTTYNHINYYSNRT